MARKWWFRHIISSIFSNERIQKKRESLLGDSLFRTISYRFRNDDLLRQALTHRSFLQEEKKSTMSNERLEFLGDAVLGLVVTDELYQRFPESREGELTSIKAHLVSREMLAKQAAKIGLGKFLFLGMGEENSGGRTRESILSNAYEALVGAIYLDGGVEQVRSFLKHHLLRDGDLLVRKVHRNYKGWLLEYVQSRGEPNPKYFILEEKGPDHKKEYTVEVRVAGKAWGKGSGFSKKKAEQEAARQAIRKLKCENRI